MSVIKFSSQICRLCLATSPTYFSIINNPKLSEMLEALTSTKVLPTNQISTVMCYKCRLNLHLAYNIQQKMIQVLQRFQIISNQINEPKEDTHLCDICSKVLPTRTKLVKHKYNNHAKRKCPICGKEFSSSNLKQHVNLHTTTNPQICELCGAVLKTKDNLRKHIFMSHEAARHKCDYCDKVFRKKPAKEAHERKDHLNQANCICDTCGKKFYSASCLKRHVEMTHLKLRPYKCDFCESCFSSRYAMKTHRRQHTNETPFRCDVCGEGFRQKVSLKSHLKSKHEIVEESTCCCTVCGKGFASKVALYSHQRVH